MFISFHQHRLKHEKGQMIPIFLAVIVAILIMALVTVNMGKVALQRTNVSNAADAGALAGGSIMALTFNGQAQLNSQMEADYTLFMATMGTMYIASIALLEGALASCGATPCPWLCCPNPLPIALVKAFVGVAIGMQVTTLGYWVASTQLYLYMRRQAKKGWNSALDSAYRYTFMNSGIGHNLIGRTPLLGLRGSLSNYADTFNAFVKGKFTSNGVIVPFLKTGGLKNKYWWIDGQARYHQVKVNIKIDKPDNYSLQTTLLPWPEEQRRFWNAMAVGTWLYAPYSCCPAGAVPGAVITASIEGILTGAMAGLAPIGFHMDLSGLGLIFIPTWVIDINHNRLVVVTTNQKHGNKTYLGGETSKGVDIGNFIFWQTQYPNINGGSISNFRYLGSIHPPIAQHDADLIVTW